VRQHQIDAVRKQWPILLVGLALGLAAAGVITLLTPRQYVAETTVMFFPQVELSDANSVLEGGMAAQQRAKAYEQLAEGRRISRDVAQRLGQELTADEVRPKIAATAQLETPMLKVWVTDNDPDRAARIAGATGDAITRLVSDMEPPDKAQVSAVAARVIEPAVVPTDATSPQPVLNLVLGGLIGLAVGMAAALLAARRNVAREDSAGPAGPDPLRNDATPSGLIPSGSSPNGAP
jgi:capsular polysaccharide biosynthesis protein